VQIPLQEADNNLLIIGSQEEIASSLLTLALFALAAQHAPQDASFYILDFRPDKPFARQLRRWENMLPHPITIASDKRRLSSLIADVNSEVVERCDAQERRQPYIYLLIYGLQRIHKFLTEENTSVSGSLPSSDLRTPFSAIF